MPPFRAYRVVLAAMADGSSELNEAEMSDLDRLQLRINQKSDETLDSTRRMREMCAEAKVRTSYTHLYHITLLNSQNLLLGMVDPF